MSLNWEEIIEDPAIDAVCIGTWPYLHAPVTLAALAAGKHVLTEARMAMNLNEALEMEAAARARPDLVAQIVPAPFTLRWDQKIKTLLASGRLGKIHTIQLTHLTGLTRDPTLPANWRQIRAWSGLNVMTVGILYETVQRWLDLPQPIAVRAEGKIITPERDHPDGGRVKIEIPEELTFDADYAEGFLLKGHFSTVHAGPPVGALTLEGEAGSLSFDLTREELSLTTKGTPQIIPPEPEATHGWRVEADFVDSIRTGKPVELTSFADGVRYMRFTQMLHDAIQVV
jgi:predicted dehydrogenase